MNAKGNNDLQSRYEFNSAWAERIAHLIIIGLAVDIIAAFILGKSWLEITLNIVANVLIIAGVWGELRFSKRAKEAGDGIVAESLAIAAIANEKAAAANERTVKLQIALEEERQKRLGRVLTKAQFDILQTLRGKVSKVYVTCDRDPEALFFSGQITTALSHAGIKLEMHPPQTGDVGTGVLIVLGSSWPGKATDHPLVEAFLKTGLLIGGGVFEGGFSTLPTDAPVLLIGRKMVELENPYLPPSQ